MPTSKEIELVLAAKLDAHDALQNAPAVGQAVAQSLERAFDGLGERIAEKLFRELKQGLSGFNLLDDTHVNSSSSKGSAGIFLDPEGKQFQEVTTLRPGQVSHHSSFGTESPTPEGSAQPPLVSSGAQYLARSRPITNVDRVVQADRFPTRGMGPATILSQYLRGISPDQALGPGFDRIGREDAFSADATVTKLKALQRLQKVGIPVQQEQFVSDEELKRAQTTLKSDIAMGASESKRLAEVMEKLRHSLEENNEKLTRLKEKLESGQGLTTSEREAMKEATQTQVKLERQIDYMGEKSKVIEETSTAAQKDLGAVQGALAKRTPLQRFVGGRGLVGAEMALDVLGQTGEFISRYNMMSREGRTGTAMLENFSARDALEGNIENLIATSKLGGEGQARSRAKFDVYTGALTKGAQGLGEAAVGGVVTLAGLGISGLGGAATATGVGAPVGIPSLLAGGLLTAGGMAATSKGVGTIFSGINDVVTADKRIEENMRAQQGLKKLEDKEYMTMAMGARGAAIHSFDTARGLGSTQFSKFLYGGGQGGIMERSAQYGLSPSETRAGLASYAQNLGGIYQGENVLERPRIQSDIVQGNRLKSKGFSSIENVTGAFYRGGAFSKNPEADISSAMEETQALYSEVKGSGGDQSGVDKILQMTAANIAGIGGNVAAAYNTEVAMGGAQAMGANSAPQREFLLQAQQNLMSQGNTGAGLEGLAKTRSVDDLEKHYGVQLSKADRMALQLTTATPDSMERMFGKSEEFQKEGGGKAAVEALQAGFKKNRLDLYTNALGDEDAAKVAMGVDAGAKTTSELDLIDKGILSGERKPKEVMGPEAPPSDLGRAEKAQGAQIEAAPAAMGLKTLSEVLPLVNAGFDQMLKRLEKVSSESLHVESVATSPPKVATARPPGR